MNRIEILIEDLCAEIDELKARLASAERAAAMWERKHNDLVMQNITHGNELMGAWMGAIADGSITVNQERIRSLK